MYKLVLFDLDGTLLDSDMMLLKTFEELYAIHRKGQTITFEKTVSFSGPPIRETLIKEFPELDKDEILEEYIKLSLKNYDKYVRLFPGVEDMLISLRRKGTKFALVTSKNREASEYTFNLLGIDGYFPLVITSDDVETLKPSPEGVFNAMKYFGVNNKDEVLYVGDGLIDYLTAKNAGIKFALVDYSPRKDNIPNDIDMLIKDWKEFVEVI